MRAQGETESRAVRGTGSAERISGSVEGERPDLPHARLAKALGNWRPRKTPTGCQERAKNEYVTVENGLPRLTGKRRAWYTLRWRATGEERCSPARSAFRPREPSRGGALVLRLLFPHTSVRDWFLPSHSETDDVPGRLDSDGCGGYCDAQNKDCLYDWPGL